MIPILKIYLGYYFLFEPQRTLWANLQVDAPASFLSLLFILLGFKGGFNRERMCEAISRIRLGSGEILARVIPKALLNFISRVKSQYVKLVFYNRLRINIITRNFKNI